MPYCRSGLRSCHGNSRSTAVTSGRRNSGFTTFYGRFRIDAETGKQVDHTPIIVQWQADEKRVVWPERRWHVEPRYPLDMIDDSVAARPAFDWLR